MVTGNVTISFAALSYAGTLGITLITDPDACPDTTTADPVDVNGCSTDDDDGDGATESGGDCNDGDPDVGPHMIEIPDNFIDDDCDGNID